MANISAPRDNNRVPTMIGVSSSDGVTPVTVYVDPITHRMLVDLASVSSSFQTDTFTSTNNQTTFTPSTTLVADFFISVNGAIQTPSTDYSIVGGEYVLNAGIPAGCNVILKYIK